ncbi:MAG: PIN domain-containing protein [Nanoarchaeota archaeon]
MKLVVDANILFSALMRDSHTRHFLLFSGHALCTSEFVFEEIMEHIDEVSKKTSLSKQEAESLLKDIISLADISIVPLSEYKEFFRDAQKICPDFDDVHYFALALRLNCAIWSNDKKLKEQNNIKNTRRTNPSVQKYNLCCISCTPPLGAVGIFISQISLDSSSRSFQLLHLLISV